MMARLKFISISLILLSNLGYGQTEQIERSLETENPISATYYLKSLKNPNKHALAEAEIQILEGNYKKSQETLLRLKNQFVTDVDRGKYQLLLGILEHKDQNYIGSIIAFNQAEILFNRCKESDVLLAQLNYWRGYTLLEQKKLTESVQSLLSALQFYKKDSARFYIKEAKIFFWLGTVKKGVEDYDSSIYFLTKALTTFENTPLDKTRDIIKVYNNLGNSYAALWNYNAAIKNYEKAIQLNKDKVGDPIELAYACSNLGLFYSEFDNHIQSEYWFKQAFDWMQKSAIDPVRKAMILQNYGNTLSNRYEYQQALVVYSLALEITNRFKEDRGDIYTQLLLNIATVYFNLEMSSKAESYKETADSFFNGHKEKWPNEYNAWRMWDAKLLRTKGEYVAALRILNELYEFYSNKNSDKLYEVILEKAVCLNIVKEYSESRELYRQLLVHYNKILPNSHPKIIYCLNDIGALFIKEAKYDSAKYYFNLAKRYNQLTHSSIIPDELYSSKIEWIVSNYHLLMIDNQLFKKTNLSINNFQRSEGLIYSTLSVLESKRIEFRNDQDAINLYRMSRDFFDEAIEYYYSLYHHTGDNKYADKAFFISEKSKYQTLQNSIKLDRVSAFAGVTSRIIEEEERLQKQVAQLEYQYSQELAQQSEPLAELVEEYISQWQLNSNRHNELIDSIKNNLPDYYNLKFNRSSVEISQIQNSILSESKDIAWVSYYYGVVNCFAIVITYNQKYFIKLAPSEELTRLLKSLNNYVVHQLDDGLQKASFSLYSGLFQSIDSCLMKTNSIKKVVIIPDGPLNYLNFELLGKQTPKSWHYLLYDYQFSYGYSSTLLWTEFSDQLKWNTEEIRMIGFAPEFYGNSKSEPHLILRDGSGKPNYDYFGFSPLEKNQDELKDVSKILNRKGGKTSIYIGSQADESTFKRANLASYNIIHLATHSFVSRQELNVAGIAFAKNENSNEDGILFMDEIFSLKNKANLICLSACETGSGVLQQGEGLVGLTRAFIYSGAQNLVVSLWKVQDESTAQLMTHFYSAFIKNHSVSKSLHNAKIAMIKKNPAMPPYYWSAFIHVGLN